MPRAITCSEAAGSPGSREMEYGSLPSSSGRGRERVACQQSRRSGRATAICTPCSHYSGGIK